MKTIRDYKKMLIGIVDNEKIYLSPPSWDCGRYWGFGYLGNKNCHYHVDGLSKEINLHDALIEHFGKSLIVRSSDLWTFAELFQSFYTLRKTAEMLKNGSAHLTNNPCKDIIINSDESKRINEIVLPSIFDEIYKILDRNQNNKKLFNQLVALNIEGDTKKVIDFMNQNSIKTDDLESIKGITKNDYHIIHGVWWSDYHKNKKLANAKNSNTDEV